MDSWLGCILEPAGRLHCTLLCTEKQAVCQHLLNKSEAAMQNLVQLTFAAFLCAAGVP
jgi:hypothetical protein